MTERGIGSNFESVGRLDELPDTGYQTISVGGFSLLVAKFEDGVFAIENMCSHANSELVGGRFRMGRISCPLHGVIFDFRTGQVMGGTLTNVGLKTFTTKIEEGIVYVSTVPNEPIVGIMKR